MDSTPNIKAALRTAFDQRKWNGFSVASGKIVGFETYMRDEWGIYVSTYCPMAVGGKYYVSKTSNNISFEYIGCDDYELLTMFKLTYG